MMNRLIDRADIQEYKSIANTIDVTKKLNPQILEAQEFDLRPFLGDEFYLELEEQVLNSPQFANTNYADLWNGSIYFCGSKKYSNPGLKVVLIYYAYARYLADSNTNQTAFASVVKTNEDSDPLSEKALGRLVGQARAGGEAYLHRVEDFLNANASDFPLFGCITEDRKTGGFRISAAGGNSKGRN